MATPSSHSNGRAHSNGQDLHGVDSPIAKAAPGASPHQNPALRDLLAKLWRGKWILLGALALVVTTVWFYTDSLPRQYQTASLIMVDPSSGSGTSSSFQFQGRSLGMQGRSLSNEILILQQSRVIAERVAERLLEMDTHPNTGRRLQVTRNASGQELSKSRVAGRVRGHVRAQLAGREVDAIRIVGSSTNPAEAALVANLYSEEYVNRTREKSRESMRASQEFLRQQEKKLHDEVREAEQNIEDFMRRTGAVALNQETNRLVSQISTLETRVGELDLKIEAEKRRRDALRAGLKNAGVELSSHLSSTLEAQISAIQSRKAEMEARINAIEEENASLSETREDNLLRMRRKSDRLQVRIDSLADLYVSRVVGSLDDPDEVDGEPISLPTGGQTLSDIARQRQQLVQSRLTIQELEAERRATQNQIDTYESRLQSIPQQSMELAGLERERRSAERLYVRVLEQLQQMRMSEEAEMGYAEIISPAGIPGRPISPDTQRNMTLAVLFGLLLGGGLVLLRDALDTRIHKPEDLRGMGLQILGVVPSMDALIKSEFDDEEKVTIDGRTLNTSLMMLTSPMSAPAEAYRRIRTNLKYARPDDPIRTLLVSSADKGEGKTTTSINVALALASAGQRTLIVDADLRRPRLHGMLDLDRSPGISEVLFDGASYDPESLSTGIDDLYGLTAGADLPNPAEVLGSQRMHDLIVSLRDTYDYVVFDTPPVLLFSDAMVLSTECDGSLLVASANRTDSRAFEHAVEMFVDVGANVLGGVLNRFNMRSTVYNYGYDYGYAHSYRRLSEHYTRDTSSRNRLTDWFSSS